MQHSNIAFTLYTTTSIYLTLPCLLKCQFAQIYIDVEGHSVEDILQVPVSSQQTGYKFPQIKQSYKNFLAGYFLTLSLPTYYLFLSLHYLFLSLHYLFLSLQSLLILFNGNFSCLPLRWQFMGVHASGWNNY